MVAKRAQYYDLDDIGAIGVTQKRSAGEVRRDAEEMSAVIRAYKLGQASVGKGSVATSKRSNQTTAKGASRTSKAHLSRKTSIAAK